MGLVTGSPSTVFAVGIDLQAPEADLPALATELQHQFDTILGLQQTVQTPDTAADHHQRIWIHPVDAAFWPALRQLGSALDTLENAQGNPMVRLVAHQGIVFSRLDRAAIDVVGSAIRTVQTALAKPGKQAYRAATPAFAAAVKTQAATGIQIDAPQRTFAGHPLQALRTAPIINVQPQPPRRFQCTEADLSFIREQLARQIGPFAAALVDNAALRARSRKDLILALSREIENASARAHFVATAIASESV